MKKLMKLNINPEKVIKVEELMVLKGGDCSFCLCTCKDILEGWGDTYCSTQAIENAIASHCFYGSGTCDCV